MIYIVVILLLVWVVYTLKILRMVHTEVEWLNVVFPQLFFGISSGSFPKCLYIVPYISQISSLILMPLPDDHRSFALEYGSYPI